MVNFKNILESVLLEASKVDVLINKFGVNSYNAEALAEIAGPLTIFLANKILQYYEKDYYENGVPPKDRSLQDRFALVNGSNSFVTERNKVRSIMDWFRVGLNGNIKTYENLSFYELYRKSVEWHDSLSIGDSKIDYDEKNKILLKFEKGDSTFYWVDLATNTCSEEAERMGHCARSSGQLYSFREYKKIPGGEHTLNRSYLTASIQDGSLLQLKGVKNSKPDDKFHDYILPLFSLYNKEEGHFLITEFGYEYDSKNDFKLSDLTKEQITDLYEKRKDLFHGRKEQKLLQQLGLIETPARNVEFTLFIKPNQIEDYVKGGWTVSKRKNSAGNTISVDIFETILSGDIWDLWNSDFYDNDWHNVIDYYINDENGEFIWQLVRKFAGDNVIDDSVSLTSAIEEYDTNEVIIDTLRRSVSDAEANSYYDYLHDALKECLEKYGEVITMNDDGVEIQINLDAIISEFEVDDENLDDYYEACDDDPSCVFSEIMGYYYEDKPKFDLDDRWTPDIDRVNFNDILKDNLNEI
jgi:hypothetical protein